MIHEDTAQMIRMERVMPTARQPLLISGLEVRVLPGSPLNLKHLHEEERFA